MNWSDSLALLANFVVLVVYTTYLIQVIKGDSTPNPATWIIWLTVSILNAITFIQVADTWYQGLISVTMTIFVAGLFFYSLSRKKFTPLKSIEKNVLVLTGIIGVLWLVTGNEKLANLLLQIALLFSFWPTIQGLRKGLAKEKPLPWILAVMAYVLIVSSMLLNFQGNYVALVYPVLNGIVGNGIVAIIAILTTKK